eukprot:1190026-Prorocentrum_minimum.AAC.1
MTRQQQGEFGHQLQVEHWPQFFSNETACSGLNTLSRTQFLSGLWDLGVISYYDVQPYLGRYHHSNTSQ